MTHYKIDYLTSSKEAYIIRNIFLTSIIEAKKQFLGCNILNVQLALNISPEYFSFRFVINEDKKWFFEAYFFEPEEANKNLIFYAFNNKFVKKMWDLDLDLDDINDLIEAQNYNNLIKNDQQENDLIAYSLIENEKK